MTPEERQRMVRALSVRNHEGSAALRLAQMEYEMAHAPQMKNDFLAKLGMFAPDLNLKTTPYHYQEERDDRLWNVLGSYNPNTDTVWHTGDKGPGVGAHEYRHRGMTKTSLPDIVEESLAARKRPGEMFLAREDAKIQAQKLNEPITRLEDLRHPDPFMRKLGAQNVADTAASPGSVNAYHTMLLNKGQEFARQKYIEQYPVLAQVYDAPYRPQGAGVRDNRTWRKQMESAMLGESPGFIERMWKKMPAQWRRYWSK
jgi:hypothetical protein